MRIIHSNDIAVAIQAHLREFCQISGYKIVVDSKAKGVIVRIIELDATSLDYHANITDWRLYGLPTGDELHISIRIEQNKEIELDVLNSIMKKTIAGIETFINKEMQ